MPWGNFTALSFFCNQIVTFAFSIIYNEYRNQIIEKGAYSDGEKAERLFDILKGLTI